MPCGLVGVLGHQSQLAKAVEGPTGLAPRRGEGDDLLPVPGFLLPSVVHLAAVSPRGVPRGGRSGMTRVCADVKKTPLVVGRCAGQGGE